MKKAKAKKNKKSRLNNSNSKLNFIKEVNENDYIKQENITVYSSINYPLFSFKYLKDISINKCKDYKFFYNFIMRLQKISTLDWPSIQLSERHSFGMEKIPLDQIKHKSQLPEFVTRETELDVFRSTGDNHAFIGLRDEKIFYIFFIEAQFGDIYDHS